MTHPLDTDYGRQWGNTLPGRLAVFAQSWPHRTALREKDLGLWKEISWSQYWRFVRAAAARYQAWGLGKGDRVSILCGNRPEWLYTDLGIELLGGLSAGVYETNPAEDVVYVVNHSHSRVIVCEDQEQVDKVIEKLDEMPQLEHIVVIEPRGTLQYDEPRLIHWDEFIAGGLALLDDFDAEAALAKLYPYQPAMIIYTSGTTGRPKGALLTHHSALSTIRILAREIGVTDRDTVLSYLPLCHVAEKAFTLFQPLTEGLVVHFGESIDTVREDLAAVSPTLFFGVPRIWEKMHSSVAVGMNNASFLKRRLYEFCLPLGQTLAERALHRKSRPTDRVLRWLVDLLVFSALRERLGLARCRFAASGAAPVAPELLSWLMAIGVPVTEGYGMTELSGLSHFNRLDNVRLGSVGQVVTGVQAKIAEDGELLVRGPTVVKGYLDNPEATAESIDIEGWLRTGDVGRIDEEGFLWLTGRKKEIMITAGGKNLSPAKIENALKTSPFIKEAVAIGDARPFVSALIQIDYDMVGNWATRRGIPYTSFPDLSGRPEVRTLVDEEIRRINDAALARVEQVRKFSFFLKELHQDDEELTATQKVRRKNIFEKYADQIEALYEKKKEEAA